MGRQTLTEAQMLERVQQAPTEAQTARANAAVDASEAAIAADDAELRRVRDVPLRTGESAETVARALMAFYKDERQRLAAEVARLASELAKDHRDSRMLDGLYSQLDHARRGLFDALVREGIHTQEFLTSKPYLTGGAP